MKTETHDDLSQLTSSDGAVTHPALVVIFSVDRARSLVLPLVSGALEIGRDELAAAGIPDGRASRRHVRVELDGHRFTVRDLGSRNGTFLDGQSVQSARNVTAPLIRIGRTLLLAVGDSRPHDAHGVGVRGGAVMGPALRALHERIALVARSGSGLLIHGESGSGKEMAAEAFHAAIGGGERPFVAVNCATIQKDLAERVLFGARRGAFTGAVADTVGLVQAADGGTLFLDEIGELDPGVQAKLLRVLETKKVTPLGAVAPVPVAFRLCAATHKDLRTEVAEGRFREDLYFRIGRPLLRVPPLRERREEIPWLIDRALAASAEEGAAGAAMTASVELVEAFMLRPWPGNVRELLSEARVAALSARADGRTCVAAADLDREAGRPLDGPDERPRPEDGARAEGVRAEGARVEGARAEGARRDALPEPPLAAAGRRRPADIRRVELDDALRASRWDLAKAASMLGISRTSLYSLIEESPHLRTAGDLKPEEIMRAFRECGGDVARMVERLEVSERALRRRLRDLGVDDRDA